MSFVATMFYYVICSPLILQNWGGFLKLEWKLSEVFSSLGQYLIHEPLHETWQDNNSGSSWQCRDRTLSWALQNVYPELSRLLDLKCLTLERIWTEFDRQLLTQAWNSIHLWNEKGPASFLVPPPAPLPQSLSSTWFKEQSPRGQKVHWECVQGELTQEKCPPSSVEGRLLLHFKLD